MGAPQPLDNSGQGVRAPEATGLGDETKPVGSPADDPPVRGSGHDRGVDPDGLDLELVENRSSSVTADQNEPVIRLLCSWSATSAASWVAISVAWAASERSGGPVRICVS